MDAVRENRECELTLRESVSESDGPSICCHLPVHLFTAVMDSRPINGVVSFVLVWPLLGKKWSKRKQTRSAPSVFLTPPSSAADLYFVLCDSALLSLSLDFILSAPSPSSLALLFHFLPTFSHRLLLFLSEMKVSFFRHQASGKPVGFLSMC